MSDRDELIAKARELSAAATPGPWRSGYSTVLCAASDATTITDRGDGLVAENVHGADRDLIAESRTILPALADLAESEGRRADEAADKLLKIAAAFNGWANGTDQGDLATLTALEMVGAALGDPLKGQQP